MLLFDEPLKTVERWDRIQKTLVKNELKISLFMLSLYIYVVSNNDQQGCLVTMKHIFNEERVQPLPNPLKRHLIRNYLLTYA